MKKEHEYTLAIANAIFTLFQDEEHGGNQDYHFELNEIDVTKFITSMVAGCNLVFQHIASVDKNNLEFTYLLNQLVVQNLLEDAKEENQC